MSIIYPEFDHEIHIVTIQELKTQTLECRRCRSKPKIEFTDCRNSEIEISHHCPDGTISRGARSFNAVAAIDAWNEQQS